MKKEPPCFTRRIEEEGRGSKESLLLPAQMEPPADAPQTRRFANGDVYTGGWKNGVVS